jgi:hypothetical protein
MACRIGEFRTSLGCDALFGTVKRGMSGVHLVDAEESREPCQTAASGGGSLPTCTR